jgi:hypothetical protein
MNQDYTPGQGCQCNAYSESECGCDVDWTPRDVYELREQRDRLRYEREFFQSALIEQGDALSKVIEQRDKALCELEMWRDGNIMHEFHRNEIQGLEQQRDRLEQALVELEESRDFWRKAALNPHR